MSVLAALLAPPPPDPTVGRDPERPQSRIPQRTLGQDDFLKLLVAQMTTQDPLNPKSDLDFIAQMAQFTSLEQSRAMSGDMTLLQANSLLGRTVSLRDDNGLPITGVVSAVQIEEGTPKLVIGGHRYGLKSLISITPTVTPA